VERRYSSYSFTTSALDGDILISAGMKFKKIKKFRYGVPAYTEQIRALVQEQYGN
jgi:hypothetical protein